MTSASERAELIVVDCLSKSYGGVRALSEVSMTLRAGEVHAVVGENGAGKSTLINLLSGAVRADAGSITVDGKPLAPGVKESEAAGIAVIHQESTAFPHLDAQDNIFVGREPRWCGGLLVSRRKIRQETEALLDRLGERIDVAAPLGYLPLAQRQMVGIARALSIRSRLLIMDEPTASLSARETETLFKIIGQLRDDGVAVLYVSHRLDEIFRLADRVTVLRDGRHVATRAIAEVTKSDLIRLMVGREVDETARSARPSTGKPALEVKNVSRAPYCHNVSLTVHAGEIVGLAGLVGCGRSELATTIFGIDRPDQGSIAVDGNLLPIGDVRAAIDAGVVLVPEDRQQHGLVLPMSVGENLILAVLGSLTRLGLRSTRRERELAESLVSQVTVKTAGVDAPCNSLSGGNQQKVVLGKWLAAKPRVLILDEPTRGIDVGARAEIYRLIRDLAAGGMATLLISSDLPEVISLSDRILVMRKGRIAGSLAQSEATQERILSLALAEDSR